MTKNMSFDLLVTTAHALRREGRSVFETARVMLEDFDANADRDSIRSAIRNAYMF